MKGFLLFFTTMKSSCGLLLLRIFIAVWLVSLTACVSFDDVDLQPIMLQPGDLPEALVAGLSSAIPEEETFNYEVAYQQAILTQSGSDAGEVRVYIFRNARDRDKIFDLLTLMETQEGIVSYETPPIGDAVMARQDISQSGNLYINLTFKHCYAVANIWLHTTDDFTLQGNEVITYAQKLDARLSSIACP
jgi:hypothetical protein